MPLILKKQRKQGTKEKKNKNGNEKKTENKNNYYEFYYDQHNVYMCVFVSDIMIRPLQPYPQ